LTELKAFVELPVVGGAAGCAAADVAKKYESGPSKTFTGMLTAVTQSPAFVIRKPAQ